MTARLEVRRARCRRTRWAWRSFGLVAGLGFVLSFGYWCTDFLVVQRAMAARFDVGRAAHAADRGVPEDDDAVHRDSAGHRGAGADADARRVRAAA